MLKRVIFLFMSIVLLTAVACQGAPTGVPEVTFVGKEYAYEGPQEIAGGWTKVTFDNQGELPHELMLVHLQDGKTLDDIPAVLESDGAPPAWVDMVGSASAEGGKSASFVSNLEAGNYAMLSFGDDQDGPPDAMQGMLAGLTVSDPVTEVPDSALPQATGSIKLVDYQFVTDGLKAGEQTVRIENDGTEMHEAIMFRLKEGKTMADFQTYMEQEVPQGEPPMDEAGGVFLSPGNVTYATLDLQAGNYVFLCFLPSEKNDNTPHFMLGMMTEVNVQ